MKQTLLGRVMLPAFQLWLCCLATASAVVPEPGGTTWTSQDIGTTSFPGTVLTTAGTTTTYTITGSGYYTGTISSDSGHFYYQPLSGDGTLVVRVASVTNQNNSFSSNSANAGIMIRTSLNSQAPYAYLEVTKSNGMVFTYRTVQGAGGRTSLSTGGSAPYWLKLQRAGQVITASISTNNTTWTTFPGLSSGITMTNLPDKVFIGLAAASNSSNSTDWVTAAIDNVTLTTQNTLGMIASSSVPGGVWQGCGLQAEYFNGSNLEASTPFPGLRVMTRIDPAVNFSWTGTPAPAVTSSTYSVRWTGRLTPRFNESYTFSITGHGYWRAWVYKAPITGGETTTPIIDTWPGDGSTSNSPTMTMTAGTPYYVQVEYTTGTATTNPGITFSWSSASQAAEAVPTAQMLPAYGGKGRVLAERWLNHTETTYAAFVSDMPAPPTYPNYPDNPTGRRFITSLNSGSNATITLPNGSPGTPTNYAEKISGYIYPPVTGTYIFYLTGHNDCQFAIRSETTTTMTTLCSQAANTTTDGQFSSDNTTTYSGANSYLFAGQRYYFELTHKQATGTKDDCAVGWGVPGGVGTEKPIPGIRMSPNEENLSANGLTQYLAQGHPRLYTDTQGFAELAYVRQANLTTPNGQSPTQENLWFLGAGGAPAGPHSLGTPTLGTDGNTPGLLYQANWLFSQPPTPPPGSFLGSVEQVLGRVSTLAMAYQLSGNYYYAHRAQEELDVVRGQTVTIPTGDAYGDTWGTAGSTAPGWPTGSGAWSTKDDLTIGNMTTAYAIGYDWLYNVFDSNEISALQGQIVNGLNAANTAYAGSKPGSSYYAGSNHACIDASGAMAGAVALGSDNSGDTATCTTALSNAVAALGYSDPTSGTGPLSFLGPDGCSPESPDYNMFLTTFLGYGLGAIETAVGGDMGMAQTPGQAKLGNYGLGITGPQGMFEYNDGWYFDNSSYTASSFWYGWKFDQSFPAWSETQSATNIAPGVTKNGNGQVTACSTVSPFDLLWYDPRGSLTTNSSTTASSDPLNSAPPLDSRYNAADIMTFRSDFTWTGMFAAIKGGANTTSHAHLHQGAFVIHANGVEWASLLGGDYTAYGSGYYWHLDPQDSSTGDRWEYYKCRAEGANTVVIGPNITSGPGSQGQADQNCGVIPGGDSQNPPTPTAIAPESRIVNYYSSPTLANVILNTTAAYPNATQALRGMEFHRPTTGSFVIIQDEITVPPSTTSTTVNWYMHYQTNGHTTVSMPASGNPITATATTTLNGTTGQKMTFKILSPSTATFTGQMTATPSNSNLNPPAGTQDPNISAYWHKLGIAITIPANATTPTTQTICVEMAPGTSVPTYQYAPLSTWNFGAP